MSVYINERVDHVVRQTKNGGEAVDLEYAILDQGQQEHAIHVLLFLYRRRDDLDSSEPLRNICRRFLVQGNHLTAQDFEWLRTQCGRKKHRTRWKLQWTGNEAVRAGQYGDVAAVERDKVLDRLTRQKQMDREAFEEWITEGKPEGLRARVQELEQENARLRSLLAQKDHRIEWLEERDQITNRGTRTRGSSIVPIRERLKCKEAREQERVR